MSKDSAQGSSKSGKSILMVSLTPNCCFKDRGPAMVGTAIETNTTTTKINFNVPTRVKGELRALQDVHTDAGMQAVWAFAGSDD